MPEAIDAVREWALLLTDETEISSDPAALRVLMRQSLARYALDEDAVLPASMGDLKARDRLRTWFEREMG